MIDKLGQEINEGSFVVFGVYSGNNGGLKVGIAKGFINNKLRVRTIVESGIHKRDSFVKSGRNLLVVPYVPEPYYSELQMHYREYLLETRRV